MLGQALIGHDLRADPWPDFTALAKICGRADVCFTDIETAIKTPLAEPPTRNSVFLHAAEPAVLNCLQALSVSLLATANNHVWDLGTGGIIGMLRELDQGGFAHAGAGADLVAAAAPAYRVAANGTVALVATASGSIRKGRWRPLPAPESMNCGSAPMAHRIPPISSASITRLPRPRRGPMSYSPIIITTSSNTADGAPPHWQRDFAHHCIDAGASLYVSHGAPRLHGVEIYRGRRIFYDLGNFIFQTATEPCHYDDEVWQASFPRQPVS